VLSSRFSPSGRGGAGRVVEGRLTAEARRQGVSVDALLARFINEHTALTQPTQVEPELPVWHLGGAGTLHRCEGF
jgi:hypothetical protein